MKESEKNELGMAELPWLTAKMRTSQGEAALANVNIEDQPGTGFPGKRP